MAAPPPPPPPDVPTDDRPNPFVDAGPFGRIEIGGVEVPGIVQSIGGCVAKDDWNFQKAGGGGGVNSAQPGEGVKAAPVASGQTAGSFAVSVWRGALLAEEMPVETVLVNAEQYYAAYDFRDHLSPNRRKKKPSHTLVNPSANFVGITRCAVRDIEAPQETAPGSGKWIFKFKVCEYNPQKTAAAGKADPAKPPAEPTPKDAREQELQNLLDEARKP